MSNVHDPKHNQYAFSVDNQQFKSNDPTPTGRQILELSGRVPISKFLLVQVGHGQPREIGPDDKVDLSAPGKEHFRALPRECTEGFSGRRQFRLPANDEKFLENLGLQWETITEDKVMRLVIYGFPVPPGYTHSAVNINFRIEQTYPDSQIDMVYFYPPLALSSGKVIGALSPDVFDGKTWQRWSRHRQPESAWRPGIDDVESHMALVNDWLKKETHNGQ